MESSPFVWINFVVILICGVLWIIFLRVVSLKENREKITLYHDTISSFCAKSDSWANRFLLTFTILISMSLLWMFSEEYNSIELYNAKNTNDVKTPETWLFILEWSAAAVFPLVGICYTEGKNIKNEAWKHKMSLHTHQKSLENQQKCKQRKKKTSINSHGYELNELLDENQSNMNYSTNDTMSAEEMYEAENESLTCGTCKIPIIISSLLHSFGALYFFVLLSFTNIWYVWNLKLNDKDNSKWATILCWILCVINFIVLTTFVTIQGLLFFRKCGANDKKSKMWKLRVASFVFETLSGLIIVGLAVISSMQRNKSNEFFNNGHTNV
eukprot:265604_1